MDKMRSQTVVTVTWKDVGADFGTGANWASGTVPTSNGSTVAVFASATPVTAAQPSVVGSLSVDGVRFAGTAGSYTLAGGGTLSVGSDGIDNESSAAQTISAALSFGTAAPTILNKLSTGTLTISGTVSNTANAPGLTVTNNGTMTVSGTLDNTNGVTFNGTAGTGTVWGVIGGAGTVGVGGTGRWIFSGANTYAGGTTISGGTLSIGADGNLGAAPSTATPGSLTFNGGTLETTTASFVLNANRGIALNANGGSISTDPGTTLTYGGIIAGAGALTKSGTGTLTLTGTNTFSGGTTISAGTLTLGNASGTTLPTGGDVTLLGTSILQANGNQTIRGLISSSATSRLNIASGNTFTVNLPTNGPATYAGTISGSGGLIKSGLGGFTLTGTNTYTGGTTLNAGTLIVSSDANLGATAGVLAFNGGTLKAGAGFASARNVTLTNVANTIDTDVNTLTFSGVIADAVTGGTLTKNGTGTLALSGNNTYTGNTLVNAGALTLTGSNASANVTVFGGAALNVGAGGTGGALTGTISGSGTVTFDRSDDSTYGGNYTGFGALIKQGAGHLFLTGNSTPANGAAMTVKAGYLDIGNGGTTGALNVSVTFAGSVAPGGGELQFNQSGPILFNGSLNGPGRVSNVGSGTTTLAGGGTYTGDTLVTAGGLADGGVGAFSTNSVFRVNAGATLSVGFFNTVAGLDDYAPGVSGGVTLSNGAVFTVNNATANTFSGALSGAGAFNKSGAGQLTLAGTSTFGGSSFISAGTLTVGATNAFTANVVNVSAGATFNVARSTGVGSLSGAGATTVAAGQTLTLKNVGPLGAVVSGAGGVAFDNGGGATGVSSITTDETYTGLTTVNNGSLNLGAGGPTGTTGSVAGNVVLGNASAALSFNRDASNYSYAGSISGAGTVRKEGGGTLTLSGANTYTGQTRVNGGTVKIGATNALPTGTSLFLGKGTLLDVSASQTIANFLGSFGASINVAIGQVFNVTPGNQTTGPTFDGVMSGAGGFEAGPNNGSASPVTFTSDNTYTGGTTIDAGGALQLGAATPTGLIAGNVTDNGVLIFQRTSDAVFNGLISGSGKLSQGTPSGPAGLGGLQLTAANTYSGGTDVYGGKLFAMNTAGSATGTGSVAIHSGGVLAGIGAISGAVDVQVGATVAPAASFGVPGQLTVGATAFAGGGRFAFQIDNANGVAGTDLSLLSITGALAITATGANPFVMSLYSINPSKSPGLLANFDPAQSYRWMFLTATGGITGFSPAAFTFDLSGFQNSFSGAFGVGQTGNNLFVQYSPAAVPEPATWALLALGVGVLLLAARDRRRREKPAAARG